MQMFALHSCAASQDGVQVSVIVTYQSQADQHAHTLHV